MMCAGGSLCPYDPCFMRMTLRLDKAQEQQTGEKTCRQKDGHTQQSETNRSFGKIMFLFSFPKENGMCEMWEGVGGC